MKNVNRTREEKQAISYYIENRERAKVSYDTYMYRVQRGYPLEQSLTKVGRIDVGINKKPRNTYKKNTSKKRGKIKTSPEYNYYLQIALKNGLREDTFYQRISVQKMDFEKAATTPNKILRIPEEYAKLAKKNNIDRKTFRQRVVTCGWSVEKAATTPVKQKTKNFTSYDSSEIKKIKESEYKERVIEQIRFYQNQGLVVPKKYLEYVKKHNINIA